jgi:nicotinamidase-related amidase
VKIVGEHAMKGTKGAQIIPELKPAQKDKVVAKISYDGFYKTRLEKILKQLKVNTVFLTGIQTDCCVRETAVSAAYRGFNVYIIEDCCQSKRPGGHKTAIHFMKTCVGKVIKLSTFKRSIM